MITDSNGLIIHMSTEEAETFMVEVAKKEELVIDEDLGLAIVKKPTIFEKYGVNCNPKKNSFHKSLYDQFERNGRLSEKQVNALRKG